MGYAHYKYVEKLEACAEGVLSTKRGTLVVGETACEGCLAGRIKESFNKTTDNRQQVKARKIYADISGIKAISFRRYKYYFLVVDNATRYC